MSAPTAAPADVSDSDADLRAKIVFATEARDPADSTSLLVAIVRAHQAEALRTAAAQVRHVDRHGLPAGAERHPTSPAFADWLDQQADAYPAPHTLIQDNGGWACTGCVWRAALYPTHLARQFWNGDHPEESHG